MTQRTSTTTPDTTHLSSSCNRNRTLSRPKSLQRRLLLLPLCRSCVWFRGRPFITTLILIVFIIFGIIILTTIDDDAIQQQRILLLSTWSSSSSPDKDHPHHQHHSNYGTNNNDTKDSYATFWEHSSNYHPPPPTWQQDYYDQDDQEQQSIRLLLPPQCRRRRQRRQHDSEHPPSPHQPQRPVVIQPLPSFQPGEGGLIIFFHVAKNGGTTIRKFLESYQHVQVIWKPQSSFIYHLLLMKQIVENIVTPQPSNDKQNTTTTTTTVVEIHLGPDLTLDEMEPALTNLRHRARVNQVPFFVFTVVREPLSYAISFYNYQNIPTNSGFHNPRFAVGTPGSEDDFVHLSLANPQCLFFCRGEIATTTWYSWLQTHPMVTDRECQQTYMRLTCTMDWIGTMEQLSTTTLPLLAYLLEEHQEDGGPSVLIKSVNNNNNNTEAKQQDHYYHHEEATHSEKDKNTNNRTKQPQDPLRSSSWKQELQPKAIIPFPIQNKNKRRSRMKIHLETLSTHAIQQIRNKTQADWDIYQQVLQDYKLSNFFPP